MKYDVVLKDVGDRKIAVIRAIRLFSDLTLKQSKDLTERKLPVVVWTTDDPAQARRANDLLLDAGATPFIITDGLSGTWRCVLKEAFKAAGNGRYLYVRRRQGWVDIRTRYFAVYVRLGKGAVRGDAA